MLKRITTKIYADEFSKIKEMPQQNSFVIVNDSLIADLITQRIILNSEYPDYEAIKTAFIFLDGIHSNDLKRGDLYLIFIQKQDKGSLWLDSDTDTSRKTFNNFVHLEKLLRKEMRK